MTAATGLAIPIHLPPALADVRERWDRAALAGAGPHVTILYPFLPAADLSAAVWARLAAVARSEPPFEITFDRVRRFDDGLVWVEPASMEAIVRLTTQVVALWPAYPPYEGLFDTVTPHLTIVESDEAPLEVVEAAARAATPFRAHATHLELWRQDDAGRWNRHWRMPLGAADADPLGPPSDRDELAMLAPGDP